METALSNIVYKALQAELYTLQKETHAALKVNEIPAASVTVERLYNTGKAIIAFAQEQNKVM